jgi:hypothetical protein
MSGERKTARMRGLREVSTVQTQIARSAPSNRTQAVSRFARLENERMRILRELETWNTRKREAERMLASVEEELAIMQALLLEAPPASRAASPLRRQRPSEPADAAPVALHAHPLIEY